MTSFSPAEIQTVKASADLLDLARGRVHMKKIAAHEWAGPCPSCGGRDRFHVDTKSQHWMCSNCTGREKWQDVIAFRRMLTGETFVDAVEALGGRRDATLPPVTPRQPDPPEPPSWKSDEWQTRATRLYSQAARRLDRADGEPGRQYLASRGINTHTADVWLLGYAPISPPWNDELGRQTGGPSITMPYLRHTDDRVMAVRYRRLDPDEDRYINMAGSTVRLFGLHLLDTNAPALVIVEGELNAISIWQASRDLRLCVVSIGGQSVAEETIGDIGRLSYHFDHSIVWCDEPAKAQKLRAAVTSPSAQMRQSPMIEGKKIDGNDMLQRGLLGELLRRMVTP